ncbi:WD40 repeat [Aphelenchoides avenae]|nr:WD40 repeat [Aphelenchus avenae]
MLAVSAAAVKNFYVAEIAYGELLETEKVIYLRDVREETNPQIKDAMMAMFTGNKREAELSFSQNGRTFRAIMFSLSMFDFNRALELAVKSGSHLDTVLGYRQRYLEKTGRRETDPNFLKHLSEVEIDWEHIREKVQEDWEKERKL